MSKRLRLLPPRAAVYRRYLDRHIDETVSLCVSHRARRTYAGALLRGVMIARHGVDMAPRLRRFAALVRSADTTKLKPCPA